MESVFLAIKTSILIITTIFWSVLISQIVLFCSGIPFFNYIYCYIYMSWNGFLSFRTKPIVNIRARIELNSTFININDNNCEYIESNTKRKYKTSCVRVNYCMEYEGRHVPNKLYFNLTLGMDSRKWENPRCFTRDGNYYKTQISKVQEIRVNTEFCSDSFVVFLKVYFFSSKIIYK